MSDRIELTFPAGPGYRSIATLVLGGVGSRLDLPYERMDDLQLALLSALEAGTDDTVTLDIDAGEEGLSVVLGPLVSGASSDAALARVLGRLVDEIEPVDRDGQEWIALRLARAISV